MVNSGHQGTRDGGEKECEKAGNEKNLNKKEKE
jgi:hypothetical protein